MQKIGFAEVLESVVDSDPRYQRDGYIFLRDALDFTTKQHKKTKGEQRASCDRAGIARWRPAVRAQGIRPDGDDGIR